MGRVIAVGPGGKAQAPARTDGFRDVIETVRARGLLDELLLSPACRGHEHADQVRRGLNLSCRYYCSCGGKNCHRRWKNFSSEDNPQGGCPDGGQRISCQADVVTVTGGDGRKQYHVQFRMFDKRESTRYVVQKYGANPSKWPYQSRAKRTKGQ